MEKIIIIPLYIQEKIFKYCFFDENNSIKWKLSLDLLSKNHFKFVSNYFTKFNCSNLILQPPNILKEKLKSQYSPFKYPILLKNISIDSIHSFIRHHYYPCWESIFQNSINSINLNIDKIIDSNTNSMLENVLPQLIKSNKELEKINLSIQFQSNVSLGDDSDGDNNEFIDLNNNFYKSLLINCSLKKLSLKMVQLNSKDLSLFLENLQVNSIIKNGNGGLEKLKLKSFLGYGKPILIDSLPINKLLNLNHLHLESSIIESPTLFFNKLKQLNNLKQLIIPFITIQNNCNAIFYNDFNQYSNLIVEYQKNFNENLLKYLQEKPNQLLKLETPFPIGLDLLDEISSSTNQSITNLSIIPENKLVCFNKYLKTLVLKSGYSDHSFKDFCCLNQNSSILNLQLNNIISSCSIPFITDFISNNFNLTTIQFKQSINNNDVDLLPILLAINKNSTINNLSICISENSPSFSNTNSIFQLISNHCKSITKLHLTLYFYFQGFNISNINSKDFKLLSIKEDYKLLFIK